MARIAQTSGQIDHCLHCGNSFLQNANRTRRFCSNACKQAYFRRAAGLVRTPIEIASGYQFTCLVCGKDYTAWSKKSQYCSQKCRKKMMRERRKVIDEMQ
jgi:predicted nucleic acid-binding Zn ribbon protein